MDSMSVPATSGPESLYPQAAPGAPLSLVAPQTSPVGTPALDAAQRPAAVPAKGTRSRVGKPQRKPCARQCGATVPAESKSGRCRACYLKEIGSNGRKTEPEEQFAMLSRMITATIKRSIAEDPSRGLVRALKLTARLSEAADDIGVGLVEEHGSALVADDVSFETGENWTRTRVWKRWGPDSPAKTRRDAAEFAAEYARIERAYQDAVTAGDDSQAEIWAAVLEQMETYAATGEE